MDADDSEGGDLAWTTRDTEVEYTCPGFGVRRDDVTLPGGRTAEYHYVDEPPAVVILPFTPDGAVVLVEEWRQAVGRVNRGLPAGTMEPADGSAEPWLADERPAFESVEVAARRELAEETGFEAEMIEPLVTVEPSNGIANSVHHHVIARGCRPTAEPDLDDDESIRPVTEPYASFRDGVLAGDVCDGRAVLAVSNYEARSSKE